ncbi:MAG: hypothetical protein JNL54_16895 [Kineosporiaceae bacterium]|nr:hypothetical protein [Kineosporiaceae bacterium]
MSRRIEAGWALLLALGATLASEWKLLSGLTTTVAGDLGDPLYFAWQLAWVGHSVRQDPASLGSSMWTTNTFQQAPDNLAYTDVVLGYLPLAFLTPEGQSGALAQLNLALFLATLGAAIGAYLLARVLGASVAGASLASIGFAFAPWRDTQVIHINILSTGGIALSAALLALGHGWSLRHGWRPERLRAGWVLAGWLVAAWQLTYGFATGIWFAYFLATIMACWTIGWLVAGRRRAGPGRLRRVVGAHLLGGGLFALVAVLLVIPHQRVLAAHPDAQRVEGMLDLFSPPWFGLLTANDANRIWGGSLDLWRADIVRRWPPEMYMSPGILLIGLAVAGVFISSWPLRRRLVLATVTAALAVASTGTRGPAGGRFSYLPLHDHLPGWEHLRTPGRLMIWVTLGLCLLAAGAISRITDALVEEWNQREELRWRGPGAGGYLRGRDPLTRVVIVGLLALPSLGVYTEGLDRTPHWTVTRAPIDLAALDQPILILPSGLVADYHLMFWTTEGWPVVANGDSGFNASGQQLLREQARTFPDVASVSALRERGIRTVVVVRSRTEPTKWPTAADDPVDGLGITRTDRGDAVVFDLAP